MPVVRNADVHHIPDVLQRLFTPASSRGIAKINVHFVPENTSPALEDALGVATITWPFDVTHFPQLNATEQQAYYLQQLQDALRCATDRYGWDTTRLVSCCAQIRNDGFKAEWWWPTKPKFNAHRQFSAQLFVQMAARTRAWVVFRQQSGDEQARVLLTDFGPGAGAGTLDYALGSLSWTNETTVRVSHENQRDYWLVSTDGKSAFVFPPAASGNAQGLYQAAMLYWEGRYVSQDRKGAMQLMQRAASLGDKHAQQFIKRNGERKIVPDRPCE